MSNTFESKRLAYRLFHPSQSEDIDWFNTEIATDYATSTMSSADRLMRPFISEEYAQQAKEIGQSSLLSVIVCRKATDIPAGQPLDTRIGIIHLTDGAIPGTASKNRKPRLLIQMCKRARGQKYGFEAVHWALDWAFETAGLHRVAVSVTDYNVRVLEWFKRIGFVEEGREREGCWYNGEWHDIVHLSLLEGEWKVLEDRSKQQGTEMMHKDE